MRKGPAIRRLRPHARDIAGQAARGALAGLFGGIAIVAAERLVLPRVYGRTYGGGGTRSSWDGRVEAAAERFGWELSPRARAGTAVVAQLAYAALLGASYAVARRYLRRSPLSRELVDGALLLGASAFAPKSQSKLKVGRRRGGAEERIRRRAAEALSAPALFQRTTTLALDRFDR